MVGRVGYTNKQLVAATIQWQYAVLTYQLLADQVLGLTFFIDGIEVDKGHAKLFGRQFGQRAAFNQLVLNEVGDQRQLIALSLLLGLLGGFFIQQFCQHHLPGQASEGHAFVHYRLQ
ncbi:hypothetical protein FQZ97_931530 [compost metagenome]